MADNESVNSSAGREKPCRVCLVKYAVSLLDKTGRCSSCADAKAATDTGMNYGDYIALRRTGKEPERASKKTEPESSSGKKKNKCLRCGKEVPEYSRYEKFCSWECHAAYEEEKRKQRLEKQEAQLTEEKNFCKYCGKPVKKPKLYCGELCKELYYAAHEEKKVLLCTVCGKPITKAGRRKFCSDECCQKHQKQYKIEKRAEKRHKCVVCGAPLHGRAKLYCSKECAHNAHIQQKRDRRKQEKEKSK